MRRQTHRDRPGGEGQGEVIEISVRPVPPASLDAGDELLQSGFWAGFKEAHGWTAHPFSVRGAGDDFGLLVLTRTLLRRFTIAYIPFGPVRDPGTGRGELLSALARALRPHLPPTTLFLRFDLPWKKEGESPGAGTGRPRVLKASSDMQPPNTVVVDIAPDLDQVLASMKSKTRYNVPPFLQERCAGGGGEPRGSRPLVRPLRGNQPTRQDSHSQPRLLPRASQRVARISRERHTGQ